jgi:hypothetical protein
MNRFAALLPGALLAATLARGAAPPAQVQPPRLRFIAPRGAAQYGRVELTFEVSNPNAAPLRLYGFRANFFSPPLPQGRVAPLCDVEVQRAGTWKKHPQLSCAYGFGVVKLPASAKATFSIRVPESGWDKVRVRLLWLYRGGAAETWSDPVPYKLVKGRNQGGHTRRSP